MRPRLNLKSLVFPAVTGALAAVITAVIVVAVDDDGGTTIIEAPAATTEQLTSVAAEETSTEPVAAVEAEVAGATVVEPEGPAVAVPENAPENTPEDAPAQAQLAAAVAAFDPVQLFEDVSPSVVAIQVGVGGGSGFFIDRDGHIVTNYHVVAGATDADVILADGTVVPAEVLGFDRANDLAVLKVDPSGLDIIPVPLADSDAVQVGEPVAAIGNPFGLQTSLTTGVVSAIERTRAGLQMGGRPQRGLIQTDAAINPGNSGGVLINASGELIGVTASVESPVRGSVGVGFAIASNTVERFLLQMIAGEEVLHPWMGIQGLSDDEAGLLIGVVVPESPAAAAGLQSDDRLLTLDGVPLEDFEQLALSIDEMSVGEIVTFGVGRDGQTIEIELQLGEWPG